MDWAALVYIIVASILITFTVWVGYFAVRAIQKKEWLPGLISFVASAVFIVLAFNRVQRNQEQPQPRVVYEEPDVEQLAEIAARAAVIEDDIRIARLRKKHGLRD